MSVLLGLAALVYLALLLLALTGAVMTFWRTPALTSAEVDRRRAEAVVLLLAWAAVAILGRSVIR